MSFVLVAPTVRPLSRARVRGAARRAAMLLARASSSILVPGVALAQPFGAGLAPVPAPSGQAQVAQRAAAGPQPATRRLDPVVVTATRTANPVPRTLADVTVFDEMDIERAAASTLPEFLRSAAGVEISQTGAAGSVSGIFVRGARTSQTLFLVDGVRLENPTSGGGLPEYLPLSAIERIEIVRGPASALYGSGAIGGVVQIFTRQARGEGVAPFASAGIGSRGTQRLQAGLSGRAGDSAFSLSAGYDRSDGFDATLPSNPDHHPDRDASRLRSATASFTQDIAAGWRAGANVLVSDGSVDLDFGCSAFSCPDPGLSHTDFRTTAVSAFLTGRPARRWESTLRIGNTGIDYDYPAFRSNARTDSRTVAWQNTIEAAGARWLFGAESIEQTIDGDGLTRGNMVYEHSSRDIDSLFGGWERDIGRHQVRLAVRHDRIERAGSQTSGSIGWGRKLGEHWLVRIAWGSAFRAPTFDDLYNPWSANPDLRPERSHGFEVAAEWRRGDDLFKATAFASRIRDAIELDADFVPQNLETAKVGGVTFEARRLIGEFALRGSVTFQDPEAERRDPVTGGTIETKLARRASRHAALGADWRRGPWRVGADLIAQGARIDTDDARMAGYGYVDVSADYRLDSRWQMFARLSNLTDREYETAAGYRSMPRTVLVGLRYDER